MFVVRESHVVYLLADRKLLFLNDHADKYAQFDLNAPKWTPMELVGKCPFGFYNAHSTWEPAAGKVCRNAPHSDETIADCKLIKAAVIKKRD